MLDESWVDLELVGTATLEVVVGSSLGGAWLLLHLRNGWLRVVLLTAH